TVELDDPPGAPGEEPDGVVPLVDIIDVVVAVDRVLDILRDLRPQLTQELIDLPLLLRLRHLASFRRYGTQTDGSLGTQATPADGPTGPLRSSCGGPRRGSPGGSGG